MKLSLHQQKAVIRAYRRAVGDCEHLARHEYTVASGATWYASDLQKQDTLGDVRQTWRNITDDLRRGLANAERDYPEAVAAIEKGAGE